jgi:hypothetical protein
LDISDKMLSFSVKENWKSILDTNSFLILSSISNAWSSSGLNGSILLYMSIKLINGLITFYNKYSKKYLNIDKGRHNNFIYMLWN